MNFETTQQMRNETRKTEETMLTRQARCGLTFPKINANIEKLIELLNENIGKFNGEMADKKVKYWVRINPIIREFRNPFNYIFLTAKGTYFDRREAITFCDSGFIGFCGEADNTNEIPILTAFGEWIAELENRKNARNNLTKHREKNAYFAAQGIKV